jgi:ribulose 1,5-bisphosphate synthetase/thiazole synthase
MTTSLRHRTPLRSRGEEGHSRRGAAASHPARALTRTPVLDALVVGGGPACLSAALVLGRARRRVLVLDTGQPANAVVETVGGLLAQGGVAPIEHRVRNTGRLFRSEWALHCEVRDDRISTYKMCEDTAALSACG